MFMHDSLCHSDLLIDEVPKIVAEQMSCTVDGEYYQLDPNNEIDLLLFRDNEQIKEGVDEGPYDITISSDTSIIVEVAAYDFEDRMANIDERIKNIATRVKELYDRDEREVTVSITFIPIKQGHWARV